MKFFVTWAASFLVGSRSIHVSIRFEQTPVPAASSSDATSRAYVFSASSLIFTSAGDPAVYHIF